MSNDEFPNDERMIKVRMTKVGSDSNCRLILIRSLKHWSFFRHADFVIRHSSHR